MKKITALTYVAFLALIALGFHNPSNADEPVPAGVSAPKAEIEKTLSDILDIVEKFPQDAQTSERRGKLRELINPRFDFSEMAQRSLGANWKDITPEQRKEFVDLFSNLLAKTYLSRIETVKRGMVKVKDESIDFPRAEVKTLVTNKGDTFPINYKLLNREKNWKVYDVIIENIGLVANYRTEFAGIIRKDTFDGLLKMLREKTQEKSAA